MFTLERDSRPFHKEDANLRSCNQTYSGIKIFITIQTTDTDKFESFVRRRWKCGPCPQFVRHLSLIVGPRTLRAEGISFDIHSLGPGDMIVTELGQYRAVRNFTNCFAISINFTLPGEPALPDNLAVCKQCGLYPLGLHRVSSPPDDGTERPGRLRTKSRRSPVAGTDALGGRGPKVMRSTRASSALVGVEKHIRGVDKLCNIPAYNMNPPRIQTFLSSLPLFGAEPTVVEARRNIMDGEEITCHMETPSSRSLCASLALCTGLSGARLPPGCGLLKSIGDLEFVWKRI